MYELRQAFLQKFYTVDDLWIPYRTVPYSTVPYRDLWYRSRFVDYRRSIDLIWVSVACTGIKYFVLILC